MSITASIVIPTAGHSAVLPHLLDVIASEPDINLAEVLVVCDGPDARIEVAESQGVRMLSLQEREGPAAARNLGVRESTGDLIIFLDDDIVPAAGSLRAIIDEAVRRGESAACVGHVIPEPSLPENCYLRFAYRGIAHVHAAGDRDPDGYTSYCTSFATVYRTYFLEIGGFDTRFLVPGYEDVEFAYRFVEKGGVIVTCPRAVVAHHKPIDRDWFIKRCEQNGRLLSQLHDLHEDLRAKVSFAPPSIRSVLTALSPLWPCCKKLLPLCEGVPVSMAQPVLRMFHAIGIAKSYSGSST